MTMRYTLVAALSAMAIAACQHAPRAADRLAQVPPQLQLPAGEAAAMVVKATGVQINECRAGKDGGFQWATGCARAHAGTQARVPYSADYYLFTAAR